MITQIHNTDYQTFNVKKNEDCLFVLSTIMKLLITFYSVNN
ncbi:hypothetical protein J2783_001070 [Chryseobacterium sediminis]|nr:hypothetical protein [Chryseobacterium sediminis]